jgi:hypothetical protein
MFSSDRSGRAGGLTVLLIVLVCFLMGCSDRIASTSPEVPVTPQVIGLKNIKEVAPPAAIAQLHQILEVKQPQVAILSPVEDQVIDSTKVEVQLQVNDLEIFQDNELQLGPHLVVIVDDQEPRLVYNLDQPLILDKLEAGTHTLRVFAAYPWGESFKNAGAYAQTTFHVLTKTGDNTPQANLPLLTYNSPMGSYGAEPLLLDFYLTNAPLHLIASQSDTDDIPDWRIRVTINGESFVLDQWQPIYLQGWRNGQNWVKLEFIDEKGVVVNNTFNTTARVVNYQPPAQDTLSRLLKGNLSAAAAKGIVEIGYQPPKEEPAVPAVPAVIEEPEAIKSPAVPTPKEELPIEVKPEASPELQEKTEADLEVSAPEVSGETMKETDTIQPEASVEEKSTPLGQPEPLKELDTPLDTPEQ